MIFIDTLRTQPVTDEEAHAEGGEAATLYDGDRRVAGHAVVKADKRDLVPDAVSHDGNEYEFCGFSYERGYTYTLVRRARAAGRG